MPRGGRAWKELEPLADRTRIHFGSSAASILGVSTPVVELSLAEAETVHFAPECLLWSEPGVAISGLVGASGWRGMANLPAPYTIASGPGRLGLSSDAPGELLAHPLEPGRGVILVPGHLVLASGSVAYEQRPIATLRLSRTVPMTEVDSTGRQHSDVDFEYPMGTMQDHLSATTDPGLLLIYARGNGFVRDLSAGEDVLARCGSVVGFDDTVHAEISIHAPARDSGAGYLMCSLTGPGRVIVQSQSRSGTALVSTAYVAPAQTSLAGQSGDADPPWMRPGGPSLDGLV